MLEKNPTELEIRTLYNLFVENKYDKIEEAANKFNKKFPKFYFGWKILGVFYLNKGLFERSLTYNIKSLELNNKDPEAYYNLGLNYQMLKQIELAIKYYKYALKINPNYLGAHNNLGLIYKIQEKFEEASTHFKTAITLEPDNPECLFNYANCLRDSKRFSEAKSYYSKAIFKNSKYKQAYLNWLSLIEENNILDNSEITYQIFLNIIKSKTIIRPRKISGLVLALIKNKLNFKRLRELYYEQKITLQEIIHLLVKEELFIEFLSICPISDIKIEIFLRFLRFEILINFKNLRHNIELEVFQIAMSHQSFINEYLLIENEVEQKFISELIEKLKNNTNSKSKLVEILCLTMYRSIKNFDWLDFSEFQFKLNLIIKRQIKDPKKEKEIKNLIPKLSDIADHTSLKIREQYEENPYPRWHNLSLPENTKFFKDHFSEFNLKANSNSVIENTTFDILIAGCGTGQHPIEVSCTFKNCQILAIDLSLNSLAYAKRKTEEFNIENIDYKQADILNLDKLNQFDIIDSVGVLHHMEDPIRGFECLIDKLKPNGLMRIGLYSKIARRNITKIQNEIFLNKIDTKTSEIKKFREHLISTNEPHHQSLFNKNDFYSTSELRDLLFNFKEHKYNLIELKDILQKLNLNFCGFENNKLLKEFKKNYSNHVDIFDLDLWNEFEILHPESFVNMYVFWCQKNN